MNMKLWYSGFTACFLIICAIAPAVACEFDLCSSTTYGRILANTIDENLEQHGYSFPCQAGDIVTIKATRNNGTLTPRIELFNEADFRIAAAGTGSPRADISRFRIPEDGSYRVVFQDALSTGKGDYTLAVHCINRPGSVSGIDFEDNLFDTLFTYTDLHVYQFDGTAGEPIILQMITLDIAVRPELSLFDYEGNLLIRDIADIGDNIAAILNYTLPYTNRYYIVAEGGVGTGVGDYMIILQRLITDIDDNPGQVPFVNSLSQNSPNPFNPSTKIAFSLERQSAVSLDIFNIQGKRVKTLVQDMLPPGPHEFIWDGMTSTGQQAASGIYLYRLRTPEFIQTRKMMLIK